MKEVTPKKLRCGPWLSSCPALFEVTPVDMRCAIGATCPAIFEVTPEAAKCAIGATCPALFKQGDGYLIIGKRVLVPDEIKHRVGDDEIVVWVPKGLVKPGDD